MLEIRSIIYNWKSQMKNTLRLFLKHYCIPCDFICVYYILSNVVVVLILKYGNL